MVFLDDLVSHGTLPDIKCTLPDYLHRPYIFRRGELSRFFFLGFLGSFSHGTLPDYLHRPYIFRRGELSRFLFWVPWEVFHTVLCLIIYIVRTSFEGDSYRVFFSGFPGGFFTRYSA